MNEWTKLLTHMRTHIRTKIKVTAAIFTATLFTGLLVGSGAASAQQSNGDRPPEETLVPAPNMRVRALPNEVLITIGYSGSTIHFYGVAPQGSDVIIKVSSIPQQTKLSKQGKMLGAFWMTVEQANVNNLPSFYAVLSSRDVAKLLPEAKQQELGVDPGFKSFLSVATVQDAGGVAKQLTPADAQEYILGLENVKEKEDLFQIRNGAVTVDGPDYLASLDLDAIIPLGDYEVTAYAVKNSQVIAQSSASFTVKPVGATHWLASMAVDKPVIYGIMSVAVALAAGLGVGAVFKGGGGSH